VVGGSRIRSIVKRSGLRAAGGYRHASTVDLVVRVTILVNQTRGRATATRSGWSVCHTAQHDGAVTDVTTNAERRYVKTHDRDQNRERRSPTRLCQSKLWLWTMVIAWFLIKVRHACERRSFRDGGIYRDTVACETVIPSFSSSPWMRGAPQRKFARAISRISWRVSRAIRGRPPRQRPRDRYFQIKATP